MSRAAALLSSAASDGLQRLRDGVHGGTLLRERLRHLGNHLRRMLRVALDVTDDLPGLACSRLAGVVEEQRNNGLAALLFSPSWGGESAHRPGCEPTYPVA
jgi:hypothetical protein